MATDKTPVNVIRTMTPVFITVPVAGGAQRDPQGGTVYASGRLILNSNGFDMWLTLVQEAGFDHETVKARFAVDATNAIVGAYPTASGVLGATQVRQYGSGSASLHLGGVFKTHPELSPKGKRQVTVGIETDADGRHFLAIDLQTPMIKRTTPRSGTQAKKSEAKSAPEAAGKATAEVKGAANPDSTSTT
jgi:hypothetical protein